jgi:NitT/TauT family transport system substrate-binding protein
MDTLSRSRILAGSMSLVVATTTRINAQSAPPTLRIGIGAASDDFAEAFYADAMGFFDSAGLKVELQMLSSGPAAANAVIGGSLDIAITTPTVLANAYLHGIPVVIIAPGSISTIQSKTEALCVTKNGPIRVATDLVGKTVGLNTVHTLFGVGLDSYLAASHVDSSAVQTVEVPFAAQASALQRGTIAAAIDAEPFLSDALATGAISVIAYPYQYIAPRFLLGAWFSTRPFVKRYPDLIKAFTRVISQTARWANNHRDQSADILAKYSKSVPDIVRSMARAEYAEALNGSDLQVVLDVSARYGLIAKPVRASDLLA